MKTDNLSDIRSMLRNSVEMSHVRLQLILWSGGTRLLMEDYLGKTVTVGWNRETENVVVIG